MTQCKCGSFAINHNSHGRDGSDIDLCDVCYWRKRAVAIAQPEQTAPPELALQSLARRCLWIAYCWNNHNFSDAYTYARKTAQELGINDFDEANKWLVAQPEQTEDKTGYVITVNGVAQPEQRTSPVQAEPVAYLHYAAKKPSERRVDFEKKPSALEIGRGWVTASLGR